MAWQNKRDPESEYLAGVLLDVLGSTEGRALLATLMEEQKATKEWVPDYVIDELDLT